MNMRWWVGKQLLLWSMKIIPPYISLASIIEVMNTPYVEKKLKYLDKKYGENK